MDKTWVELFAKATYKSGGWQHPTPDDLASFRERQIFSMIEELAQIAETFSLACQEASRGTRAFRVVSSHQSIQGFIFMLERLQTKVQLESQGITSNLLILDGFTPKSLKRCVLTPTSDAFGGLTWYLNQTMVVTAEQFVKILAEDMLRAAFETGDMRR